MSLDPARPADLEVLLSRHGIQAKKRLGQNFLIDPELRDRIADVLGPRPDDEVLEVGAGAGTLTVALAPACGRLVAVELDRRLSHALRSTVRAFANVEVLEADIMKLDLGELFPTGDELVAGNIPYYLTGALIRRLLENEPRPRRLALVVQREVAERWTASHGASLATVAVQVYAEARLEFLLPPRAFDPPPKVESALVVLEVRARPAVQVPDLPAFFRFVEQVFQFRRKQLGPVLARVTGSRGEAALRLGIDPTRRAETLSLAEWEALYLELAS
ncbi:MAG TPA: 16S rRNA (adenine(1518)-N(6)/adenine(1519)-N(6))-dimethyltransferase RsmA [Candidatus Dormibacteraeota bacterium]